MERREFMNRASLAAGLALLGSSAKSFAQVAEEVAPPATPSFAVAIDVQRNHGHEIALTDVDVIKLLRQVHPTRSVSLSIKGQSSHPHTIALNEASIVKLLAEGRLELNSSSDAGHAHLVVLTFAING